MTKKSEKNKKKFAGSKKDLSPLTDRLKTAIDGLLYVSEIDAPFGVIEAADGEKILSQIENNSDIEEVDFERFFERLTRARDWFGERESKRAKRFLDLQKLIEESLIEPKVYRVGRIRIRIIIIGRTENGLYLGLETNAIET